MKRKTLKLVSLNAWGGRALDPLLDFFSAKADSIDIFCLQEMFDAPQQMLDKRHPGEGLSGDMFRRVGSALPGFQGVFARFDESPARMSLAMFIRHGIPVRTIMDTIVYRPDKPEEHGSHVLSSRKIQVATIVHGHREIAIANFHGLWCGGHKRDTLERIAQADGVHDLLDGLRMPRILCGDFNLLPGTRSLWLMAQGMREHVTTNGYRSTRTPLYRHYDDPSSLNFADYMLTSPEIHIHGFEVMPDQVSDHSPLLLEFS